MCGRVCFIVGELVWMPSGWRIGESCCHAPSQPWPSPTTSREYWNHYNVNIHHTYRPNLLFPSYPNYIPAYKTSCRKKFIPPLLLSWVCRHTTARRPIVELAPLRAAGSWGWLLPNLWTSGTCHDDKNAILKRLIGFESRVLSEKNALQLSGH